jgi:hypothetical protein
MGRDHFAFSSPTQLATPRALGYLRTLELSELVEDAVGELSLGSVVASVVESADLRAVLLELPPQEIVVGGLSSEAVPVLGEHHRNAAVVHQVPHPIHPRTLEARPALARVLNLLEDLVALACCVLPQRF